MTSDPQHVTELLSYYKNQLQQCINNHAERKSHAGLFRDLENTSQIRECLKNKENFDVELNNDNTMKNIFVDIGEYARQITSFLNEIDTHQKSFFEDKISKDEKNQKVKQSIVKFDKVFHYTKDIENKITNLTNNSKGKYDFLKDLFWVSNLNKFHGQDLPENISLGDKILHVREKLNELSENETIDIREIRSFFIDAKKFSENLKDQTNGLFTGEMENFDISLRSINNKDEEYYLSKIFHLKSIQEFYKLEKQENWQNFVSFMNIFKSYTI